MTDLRTCARAMSRVGSLGLWVRIKVALLLLLIACSLSEPAWAACDDETIDTISEDGDLIVLSSGESYDVAPGDEGTASTWQEGEDVLVCGDTIINKDENGEKIEVTPH
jgi:hypothetical protein